MAVVRSGTFDITIAVGAPATVTLTTSNVQVMVTGALSTGQPDLAGGTWVAPDAIIGANTLVLNVGPTGTVNWPSGNKAYVLVRVNNIAPLHPIMFSGLIDIQF